MDAENPLLRAVRAFEEATLEDAEFALTLVNRVMDRKRERFVESLDGKPRTSRLLGWTVPADALRRAAMSMTTSELAKAIGTTPKSIAPTLARDIRDKGDQSRFVRVRNGVFALREWRKTDQGDDT